MIKVCVFDLDGTLYNVENKITKVIDEKIKNFLLEETKMSETEFKILEKNKPDIIEALEYLKLSKKKYYKFVYDNIDYNKYFLKDLKLLNSLKSLKCKKIVCSNSPKKHIKKVLQLIGIKRQFNKVYSMQEVINKKECYKKILKRYNITNKEMIVIGNDYNVDIKPANELKIKTILIDKKEMNCIEAIKKIKDRKER